MSPYINIDDKLCNGCVLCMKACPTKAIRVKDRRIAQITGVCIDCSECIRVCPRGAATSVINENYDFRDTPYSIASPSTVLYAQYGSDFLPNDILLGLNALGFRYVHDQSYTNEVFNFATELYIRKKREDSNTPFPLISPICPVVIRLIAHRFPSLLNNILPLATPFEIDTREAKKRLSQRYKCRPDEITVFHVTPCAAMMSWIKESKCSPSLNDKALGIGRIYEELKYGLNMINGDKILHHSSGIGLGWGMTGGEIAGLDLNCLAVSGLHETIRYLEKMEMGLLGNIDYAEFRVCSVGCLGGPLTVADKYSAKHYLRKLIRMYGIEKRIKINYLAKLYDGGWFFSANKTLPIEINKHNYSVRDRINWHQRVEDTLKLLPRKECGVCGAPDCRTMAQDIVDGKGSIKDCIYLTG